MQEKKNILVTGCGGDIGQSIGKILNESSYVNELHGCDISDKNAAQFIFPNFFIGLRVTDESYLENLEKEIIQRNIDLVIPVSEPELRFFSKKGILEKIESAKMVVPSAKALEIGFDKLKTATFLHQSDLPFPETQLAEALDEIEQYPVIMKSRTGSGSSAVNVVENAESFALIKKNHPDFIVQEYLEGDDGEFTCGLFRSREGEVRNIIFKRELTGGFSGYGEVVENSEIEGLLIEIATRLELRGSINVQLRLTTKGPVVFEINPRFSSTVRFRDLFGFKDLEWSLQDTLNIPLGKYEPLSAGRKFYKGFNEYIS